MVAASSAMAGLGLDLVGAVTSPMATGTPTPSGTLGFPGGGLIFNFPMGSRVRFELGGLYLTRKYTANTSNTLTMINGQLGFKLLLARVLYLDVGGYDNIFLTNPQSLSGTNAGIFGGVGILIPFSPKFALVAHGQYQYALSSLTYSGGTITPTEVVGMAGFSFGMNRVGR